jgi:hypothetical protein
MSFQIETAYVSAYKQGIDLGIQQRGSRLRPYVRVEPQNAEYDFYDRIGLVEAVEITSRHSDTPLVSTPTDRRRVNLRDFDWADLIDKADRIRILTDPASAYTQNAIFAMGRSMDRIIIGAATGPAYTGKDGSTVVNFPAGQTVPVNYVETGSAQNSNLTIAKLRQVRFLMESQEAIEDGETVVAVVTASQVQALLMTTEVTNSNYNTVKALAEGAIDTFMGFKFVRTQLLAVSGTVRTCLFWAMGGMLLAVNGDTDVDVGPRRDKRNSIQVYVNGHYGSTRMWEPKVVAVLCDESTT